MICQNCSSEIEESWNFCASCGACIAKDEWQQRHDEYHMAEKIRASILASLQGHQTRGYASNAIPPKAGERTGVGQNMHFKRHIQADFLNTPNKPLEVVEPKTDITRMPGKVIFEAELPCVESGSDIKIMVLSESLEIRAVSPGKMYMKIVPMPKNMELVHSAFIDGKLRVEIGHVRRLGFPI